MAAGEEGQSLIELALMVPIFTILVCYAVDFGFFFLVATSLNSAARNAMEYAIQGTSSPAQAAVPSAAVVSNLAIASIGLSSASTATVSVRICSSAVGVNTSGNTAQCATPSTGAGAVTGTPDMDPESPKFQLNRVDVGLHRHSTRSHSRLHLSHPDLPSHGGNEAHAMNVARTGKVGPAAEDGQATLRDGRLAYWWPSPWYSGYSSSACSPIPVAY